MASPTRPAILLTFANDRADGSRYLRNLPEEARQLRAILEPLHDANRIRLIERPNVTLPEILNVFQNEHHRNRIAIFHFGGHSDSLRLMVETPEGKAAPAFAEGLAGFLAQQQGLRLVFLNGCANAQQVKALHEAGVGVVIATLRGVDDEVARLFAVHFYQGLAGRATVQDAFKEAKEAVRTTYGSDMRKLYAEEAQGEEQTDIWPWGMYVNPAAPDGGEWKLPPVAGPPVDWDKIRPRPVDEATLAAARDQLASLPTDHVPPVGDLPPGSHIAGYLPNPLFVGREETFLALAQTLKGGGTAVVNQAASITGVGGVGKTQTAVEFAHRYGCYFAGGVYWLSFGEPAAIRSEIVASAQEGGLEVRLDFANLDLDQQLNAILAAWQSPLPRLLVFDNCEDEQLLAQWRPPTGGCRVLVTSRRDQWDPVLGLRALPLDVLPRDESVALLHKFRPELAEGDPGLDAIAEELGDLPLALHLAGSYLARYKHSVTLEGYLQELQAPALLEHASLTKGGISPTRHEQHVARTFALSFDRLDPADATDTLAIALLARAACFAPGEPIPRDLLSATVEVGDSKQVDDALRRLGELGLLQEEAGGALRLHRLLVRFVETVVEDGGAQQAVEEVVLRQALADNKSGYPGRLLAWQAHLRHVTDAAVERKDERAAALCDFRGCHLMIIGDPAAARPYLEQALAIRREVLGERHPDTASSLNNLGYLLKELGDLAAARPYFEQALAVWLEVFSERHPDIATSLNNLGALLEAQGRRAAARPYYEQALAIYREVLGERHPDTASSLNNLGLLLQAMGDLAAARPHMEQALAIRREVLGERHPDTALSLSSLGSLLQDLGQLAAARPYYEQALAIKREVLGERHPATATSLNNLGLLLRDLGDPAAARPYLEQALAIRREVLGERHPDTAVSLNNLGLLLQDLGQLAAARPYFEQALAIFREVLGARHPLTITGLNNLGLLLQAQGDLAGARPYLEQALAIQRVVLGERHPHTATCLNNLGSLLHELRDLAAALPYLEQALAMRRETLGERHPDTATSLNNLGLLLRDLGELAAARPYLERALTIRREVLGEHHLDTATSLNSLGYLLLGMGDLVAAKLNVERALTIHREVQGEFHLDTANSLNNLGHLLRLQGEWGQARQYLQQALDILELTLGPNHPHTRLVRDNLESLDR